jgi:U3 small nucleolar RNA-associated protein 14
MLQMNKISVEEVAHRRAELRKMRELMFRAEVKAKRIAKIKSKTYRKIKRKERERLGEKLGEGEESETEEGKLKREVDRARERATLRHKHTGKWAKHMRGREGDEQGRKDIEEMLERGEKLRRRIRGVASDQESDDEENDDDSGGDGEGGVDKVKQAAFDELQKIDLKDREIAGEQEGTRKSIFNMKFMKDAMARQQEGADKMADGFIKEFGTSEDMGEDSEMGAVPHDMDAASGVVAVRTGGRVVYRPGVVVCPQPNRFSRSDFGPFQKTHPPIVSRPVGSLASDTSSVTLKSTDLLSPPSSSDKCGLPTVPESSATESNPWLAPQVSDVAMQAPRKKNEVLLSKDSAPLTKSKNKLKKQAKKREEEKEKMKDDAAVEISLDNVLSLGGGASTPTLTLKSVTIQQFTEGQNIPMTNGGAIDDDEDANSEVEAQEKAQDLKRMAKIKGPKAFEQRDLVALAFAGDNVVHVGHYVNKENLLTLPCQEFEEAKRREIAADAPREVDTTIPGWVC